MPGVRVDWIVPKPELKLEVMECSEATGFKQEVSHHTPHVQCQGYSIMAALLSCRPHDMCAGRLQVTMRGAVRWCVACSPHLHREPGLEVQLCTGCLH